LWKLWALCRIRATVMAGLWEYLRHICRWRKNEKHFLKSEEEEEEGITVILNFSIILPVCRATSKKV